MSRINTNVPSLIAQRVLGQQQQSLNTSLERLSTGLRINRGRDDPAGLIISETLRSEMEAIKAAVSNAQRAEQVVNTAEGALQEINNLLLEVQSLVGQSANEAGVSAEEKQANQLQIDSILQTIDRIANATTFNEIKLLNGNLEYTIEGVSSRISDVTVNAARLPDDVQAMEVTVEVLQSAQTGVVFLSTTGAFDNGGNGSVTIELTGVNGVQQFTFASTTTQANIINAINTFTDALGVSASVAASDPDLVEIRSTRFGSAAFVRAKVIEGTSDPLLQDDNGTTLDARDEGRDASVIINGNATTADGLEASVASDGFDLAVRIGGTSTLNTDTGSGTNTSTFTITGGGADFHLSPRVNLASKVSLGIPAVTTGNLGDADVGRLSALKSGGTGNVVNGDLTSAQRIVDETIKQVSSLRGRLGAFQSNTVQSTINNLGVSMENIAAANSVIRDTDFASETAMLTRQQILTQAGLQSLTLANTQPQTVLQLLAG